MVCFWGTCNSIFIICCCVYSNGTTGSSIVITSAIALLCTKPLLKAFHLSELIPTNTDRLIGKEGEVIKDISFNEYGRVKVFGENWMATSEEPIKEGSKVIIKNIEGAKLIVEKKKEEK